MLQGLLENPFQLKFHNETKEMSRYTLVAGQDGLKPPDAKESSCWQANGTPPSNSSRPKYFQCGRLIYGIVPTHF